MTIARTIYPYFATLALLAACSDGEAGDSDTDPTGTSEPLPAGCECKPDDPCNTPLCETVDLAMMYSGENEIDPAFDAALTCTLEALRDHKVGSVRWEERLGETDAYQLFVSLGDGTARRTTGGSLDLCQWNTEEIIVGPLAEPAVFDACLAETDVNERIDCFKKAVTEEATVCQEGDYACSE